MDFIAWVGGSEISTETINLEDLFSDSRFSLFDYENIIEQNTYIFKNDFQLEIKDENSQIVEYEFRNDSIIRSNICQYCKHRMSYINITGETESSDFYYKCRRRNIDILLSDSCEQFAKDFNIK